MVLTTRHTNQCSYFGRGPYHTAAGPAARPGRPAAGERLHHLAGLTRSRTDVAARPQLVRHGSGAAQAQVGNGHGDRSRHRTQKKLIEAAYTQGERLGLAVWGEDEAGPFQTIPYPGQQWCPAGHPARYPHEHVRNGTAKLLTLFHPASGAVRVKGITSCHNAVLHGWLQTELTTILAALPSPPVPVSVQENRANWERWQEGLAERLTLKAELPPLRMLLVLDNLAGHKTASFVCWLFDHGIMPLYTPAGRLLAQHDRVSAAHPQATRARGAASDGGGRDHRGSGSRRAGRDRGANPLRRGGARVRPPQTQSPTTPCSGRFRSL